MSRTTRSKKLRRLKGIYSLANRVFIHYKKKCKVRKINFDIERDFFIKMIFENCYLCGNPPINAMKRTGGKSILYYNGLDRINNNIGYVKSNVRTCCKICNGMKSNMKLRDFKNHVEKINDFKVPFENRPTRPKDKRD